MTNSMITSKPSALLTIEEEHSLARRWQEHQDYDARERLVLSHLRLVAKIAAGYRGYGLNNQDLISEGVIGLMRAIDGFNPDLGYRLSTYAMWWIKACMTEYIINSWSIVRTGSASGRKKLFFGLRGLKKRLGIHDSGDLSVKDTNRISSLMGVSKLDVIDMNRRLSGGDVSLNATVSDDTNQEHIDRLTASGALMDDAIIDHLEFERRKQLLHDALTHLNKREQHILTERQMKDEPTTLQSLAHSYGISRERVRQIEAGAVRKIKKIMRDAVKAIQSQDQEMGTA